MSNQSGHVNLVSNRDLRFSHPVRVHVQDDWVFAETVEQADACLRGLFAFKTEPSYLRAISTCAFAFAGQVPPDAVQATLLVAAMEAGFAFEVLDAGTVDIEREVEAAAARGLEELVLAEAAE